MKTQCRSAVVTAILGYALLEAGCSSQTYSSSDSTIGSNPPPFAISRTESARNNPLIRLVNTSDEPVDLYFGDTKVFAGIDGQKITTYRALPAESQELKVALSGRAPSHLPLARNSENLRKGSRYTAFTFKKNDGSTGITVLEEISNKSTVGKAQIRIENVVSRADEGLHIQ